MTLLADPPIEYPPGAVKAAEAMVRAYCGWHIAPAVTETLTLDGKGGSILVLPSLRVTAITTVVADGVTLAASAYSWSQSGLVERVNGFWPRKFRSIAVSLTHGYTTCPLEVRDFIQQLAENGAATPPLTKAQVGQVVVTYSAQSPAWSVLDPYRRHGVA